MSKKANKRQIIDLVNNPIEVDEKKVRYDEILLGSDVSFDIWHPSYSSTLHQPPHPAAIFDDEEEQTYNEFVEMGKRHPNTEGTGRWTLTNKRRKLALYYFGKDYNKNMSTNATNSCQVNTDMLQSIREFISIYFQLDVDYFEQFDAVDLQDNCFHLSGLDYDINVFPPANPLKKAQKLTKKQKSHQEDEFGPRVDVFSLFDVLVHEAKEPYVAIVGLFDCALGEAIDTKGKKFTDVLGRACGDRVACVSLPFCSSSCQSLWCTIAHELLHTIGFDHCTSYQCIMNAIGCEDWIFLSPVNLRKLKVFHQHHEKHDNGHFIISRYESLLAFFKKQTIAVLDQETAWLERKIEVLKELQDK